MHVTDCPTEGGGCRLGSVRQPPSLPLIMRETRWSCPNCTQTALTTQAQPHTRFHQCRGLHGLTAPLTEDGTRCRIYAVERDDYVSGEAVQLAPGDGRPYMSVITERADGSNDCTVYAPLVTGSLKGAA